MTFDPTLYFITDSTGLTQARLLEIVAEACQGGATLVQLREKNRSTRAYLELALAVKTVTDAYQVPLIIDDRVDIALASGAAGVHVGAEDMPVALARRLMGPDRIVGATAKTVERALQAQEEGADYLGVGAIYPTLTEICQAVQVPVCAIGGLNPTNCDVLAGSGISGICAVSAIMKSEDPRQAASLLRQKAEELKASR